MNRFAATVFLFTPACFAQPANVLLVNAAATPGGNGRSWATAFNDLQDALALAANQPGQFTEAWLASGVYQPSRTGDRNASFVLPSTFGLFGGFAGGETDPSQRTPAQPPTVLSGDLGGNDIPGDWVTNRGDNSLRLLYIPTSGGSVRLDGLTIRSGHNTSTSAAALRAFSTQVTFQDCAVLDNYSGTLSTVFVSSGPVTIRRSRFVHNFSYEDGGAVNAASIDARGSLFELNATHRVGGALRSNGSVAVDSCDFVQNSADNSGAIGAGTLSAINSRFLSNRADDNACVSSSTTVLTGCLFRGNMSVYPDPIATGTFASCTFIENISQNRNGRLFIGPASNCISWGNISSTGWPHELDPATSTNCCIQGLTQAGNGNFGDDPLLDASGRPMPSSPCIDTGLNSAVPAGLDRDAEGKCRFVDGDLNGSAVVDVGAYEFQTCPMNCDCSTTTPLLNVLDFSCFLNRFQAADPWANCDGSTAPPVLNVLDFNCFLNRFTQGCP